MREIKFRVWDNNCEQYCDEPGYIVVFGGGNFQMFNDSEGEWEENGSNGSDLTLEQYTGLKDRNGVEIYENDIINTGSNSCVVVWANNGWFEKPLNQDYQDFVEESVRTYPECQERLYGEYAIVIGNIHENKDLLK